MMFGFDGKVSKVKPVRGSKGISTASTQTLVENARRLREQRAEEKQRTSAAISIQRRIRGVIIRRNVYKNLQLDYANRLSGIVKINAHFSSLNRVFVVPTESIWALLRLFTVMQTICGTRTASYDRQLHEIFNASIATTSPSSNLLYQPAREAGKQSSAIFCITNYLKSLLRYAHGSACSSDYLAMLLATLQGVFASCAFPLEASEEPLYRASVTALLDRVLADIGDSLASLIIVSASGVKDNQPLFTRLGALFISLLIAALERTRFGALQMLAQSEALLSKALVSHFCYSVQLFIQYLTLP